MNAELTAEMDRRKEDAMTLTHVYRTIFGTDNESVLRAQVNYWKQVASVECEAKIKAENKLIYTLQSLEGERLNPFESANRHELNPHLERTTL